MVQKKELIGINYKFELQVNYSRKKIFLFIYNNNNVLIDQSISWSFELLNERLNQKLKYLAIIKANSKIINKQEYFKYEQIKFYKLKDFRNFLTLIDNGLIRITFKIGVFRDGKRYGNTHNHGTGFDINEKYLFKLYDRIF